MRFRAPLLGRLWVAGFGLFWCGSLVTLVVRGARGDSAPAGFVVPGLMLVFGVTLCLRLLRTGVDVLPDELVVRNYWRTRRIARRDVEDFRIGDAGNGQFGRTLHVLSRDGSVLGMDTLTAVLPRGRGVARLTARRDRLLAWRAGTGPRIL